MEETIQSMYDDIQMLTNLLKHYNNFLEELEATTTSLETAGKIRSFLIDQKVWNNN
jgi:hypothetical protein